MMPNIVKGSDLGGLMRYLAGPGRANEHTNPKILAGDLVTMAVYAGSIDVPRATELAKYLDSPRQTVLRGQPVLATNYRKAYALIDEGMERKAAFEEATKDQNAWHCALSLDPREGQLSEEKWAAIARRFMAEMGFTDRPDGTPDVRWATVHHGLTKQGGDHIHIAMSVVRPDGSLADVRRDWPRSQEAAGVLEREFGLKVLSSREELSTEQATRPDERARAERVGALETDREALRRRVRAAAVASENEAEFVRALKDEGIVVRPRYAKGGTEEVTGYAVRMAVQTDRDTGQPVKPIWYSGGQLGKDLTLSAMRSWTGWVESDESRESALAEWGQAMTTRSGRALRPSALDERAAIDQLAQWSAAMREIPVGDREAWARAASQTAGLFAAASLRTETAPGPLDQLARQLARAAQLPAHQRRPRPVQGTGPASVARMLLTTQKKSRREENVELVLALTECLLTVADMLAETKRAKTAAAMTAQAQRALTEIHMRAVGIDPNRPHTQAPGSPPWVAAARAEIVVQRLDRDAAETQIESMTQTWRAARISMRAFDTAQVDEFGHVLKAGEGVKAVRMRSFGPPTPLANADRATQRERDRIAAEADARKTKRDVDIKETIARMAEIRRANSRPFDPSRVRSADLSGSDYDTTADHPGTKSRRGSRTPEPETSRSKSRDQQQNHSIRPPRPPQYGRDNGRGFER
ncbi:relaxase/mobilization nuclease domain-containing protein [Nocardia rhamnosiphila]|uniref:Relaxase/mobilization nuclease domain-containing protein n=1 Tax=Nocardia rhamnosiphila TaxID=426716 RepID=A0ABV2X0Z5_9NOCA